ncbi:helix-turn-helix domain-containing protein [Leucobacter coleopterorum]|uniref:Helix-turn-helix domain-containing protein n=1 Tax=Leucobacter coleopterorum TaxID=2714933 RepID=A0ABX6JV71_9MICO|nr:GyrI-like domain-containing protein [Leucobacter coleopterorum]QIM18191.1 helix-turn-helix domain-containing protein [Leucobacter coleopterorum]
MPETRGVVSYEERFDLVLEHIYRHPDQPLDLLRLSEVAGFSPRHWHRVFSAAFGESAASLVKRVRMQRATVLLAKGKSIHQTAVECGYPDVSSFTRAFRQSLGVSPANYRDEGAHVALRVARVEGDPKRFCVTSSDFTAVRCVAMRHYGSFFTIDRTFQDLQIWARGQGIQPELLDMYGVYLSDPSSVTEQNLESLACLALPQDFDGDFRPLSPDTAAPEEYTIRGGHYAVMEHRGAYADMPDSYAWLFGCWVPAAEVDLDDSPVVEHYVSHPRGKSPVAAVTRLMLPIKDHHQLALPRGPRFAPSCHRMEPEVSVFTTKPSRSKRKRAASAFVLAAGLGLLSVVPATVASADPLVPVGQNIYLADLVSSTPAWFDASDQTWKTLTLPNDSSAVVVSPDAKTVYFNSPTAEAVFEVDAESAALVRTIPLGVNAGFIGGPLLALDPSGSHLYVAGVNGVVSRIDTATGTVTGSIDVGGQLGGVATSQDGATVFVAGWADNTLVELDAATMTVTRTTPVDNDPQGLQVSPDGASLYIGHTAVTNATSAALTVLDTATAAKQWTVTRDDYGAIQGPSVLALSADGSKLYGVDRLSGHAMVDTATRVSTRGTLPLSATPFPYMGLTADSRTALFSMSANGITYLDTATNAFSPAEARGASVGGVAFAPDQAPIAEFTATRETRERPPRLTLQRVPQRCARLAPTIGTSVMAPLLLLQPQR